MTQIVQDLSPFPGPRVASAREPFLSEPGGNFTSSGSKGANAAAKRHFLIFKFALFNMAAFAFLSAAYHQGWLTTIFVADDTGMSAFMFFVFLGGLAICARKTWQLSGELECVRSGAPCEGSWAATYLSEVGGRDAGSRSITGAAMRMRIANGIAVVRHIANSLVLLGLIGTVVGFVIALSGVDPSSAGNISHVGEMITQLVRGMSVALYTTLVGSVLSLWLTVNFRFLMTGSVDLSTSLIAFGESNARTGTV